MIYPISAASSLISFLHPENFLRFHHMGEILSSA